MTDTETAEKTNEEKTADAVQAGVEATKPPKIVKQPHACLCSTYELVDPEDSGAVFQPECGLTTFRTFGQGHDARLVSFLVDGHFDGLKIRQVVGGTSTWFATPADALENVSDGLHAKAVKATENRRARIEAKAATTAQREAKRAEAKAAKEKAAADKASAKEAAKATKSDGSDAKTAEVVADSREGDLPELSEGQAVIKVGRFEYLASIDDQGVATYTDGAGAEQTREDGYKMLRRYEAPVA